MKQSLFLLALICSVFAGYAGVPYVTYPYDSRAVALTNPANKFAGNGGFLSNITFSAYAARAGAATDATNLWSGGHFASPIFTLDSLNAGTAWRIGGSGGLFVTGDDNAQALTVTGDIIAQGGAFKGDVVASTFSGLIVPGSATNGAGSRVAYLSDITGGAATNVVWPAIGTNTFMDTNGAVVTVSSMTDTGVVSILASQAIVTNLSTTLSNRTGNLFIWVAGFPFAFTSTGFLQTDYLIATNGLLMGGPLTQYGGATATFSGLVGGTNGFYAGWGGSYAGKSILTNANGAPLVDDYTAQRGSAILTNLQNGDGSSLQSIRGDRINVKFGAAGSTNGATGQVTVTPGTGSGTTNAFDTNAFTLFAKNLAVGTNISAPQLNVQNAYVTNLLDGSGNPWGSGITTNVSTTLSNNTANLFVWVAGFPFTFTSSGYAGIGTLLATNGIISGGPITVEAGDITVGNKIGATNGFYTGWAAGYAGLMPSGAVTNAANSRVAYLSDVTGGSPTNVLFEVTNSAASGTHATFTTTNLSFQGGTAAGSGVSLGVASNKVYTVGGTSDLTLQVGGTNLLSGTNTGSALKLHSYADLDVDWNHSFAGNGAGLSNVTASASWGGTNYMVNVADFGARTNAADNAAAFAAAIQSATNNIASLGGTVYIPSGRFTNLTTIQGYPGIYFKGAGREATELYFPNAISNCIVFATNGFNGSQDIEGIGVEDLTIRNPWGTVTNTGAAIYADTTTTAFYWTPTFRNLTIKANGSSGIYLKRYIGGVVENAHVSYNSGPGIYALNGNGARFAHNYCDRNKGYGHHYYGIAYSEVSAGASDSNEEGGYLFDGHSVGVSAISLGAEQNKGSQFWWGDSINCTMIDCTGYRNNAGATNGITIDGAESLSIVNPYLGTDSGDNGWAVFFTAATSYYISLEAGYLQSWGLGIVSDTTRLSKYENRQAGTFAYSGTVTATSFAGNDFLANTNACPNGTAVDFTAGMNQFTNTSGNVAFSSYVLKSATAVNETTIDVLGSGADRTITFSGTGVCFDNGTGVYVATNGFVRSFYIRLKPNVFTNVYSATAWK